MGIRFSCHACAKPLNIKSELAGRRGICPQCSARFRIPLSDSEFSTPLSDAPASDPQQQQRSTKDGSQRTHRAGSHTLATATGPSDKAGDAATPEDQRLDRTAAEQNTLLSGDPGTTWYVRPPSGGQFGPATNEVLQSWISEGRVAKTALLWRDGWPQWREASEVLTQWGETLPDAGGNRANDAFSEPAVATTPVAAEHLENASATEPSPRSDTKIGGDMEISGDMKIGAIRRQRSTQRMMWVAVLATLVVALIITLVVIASNRG